MIFNFIQTNEGKLLNESPFITQMCLPGLAEDIKMSVFFHLEQYSNLKVVYVTDATESDQAQKNVHKYETSA